MTTIEINLALLIVKESFGDLARRIAAHLVLKKSYPIALLAEDLNLNKKLTAQILSILIKHHLVEYKLNQRQIVEYKFLVHNALNRLKLARTIQTVRSSQSNDKNSELILRELLLHGSLEMSNILLKLLSRQFNENNLKQKLTDLNAIFLHFNMLKESFCRLVEENFIEREPQLDADDDEDENTTKNKKNKTPKFMPSDINRFLVPDLQIDELRMKKSIEEDSETVTCNVRRDNENFGDNGIYWRINEKKIMQHFRDDALVEAMENRIDQNAGKILRAILKLADARIIYDKAISNTFQSKPVTMIDLQRLMRSEHGMDAGLIEKYMNVITQDSFKILERIGDFSGGAFCIDFKKALTSLCIVHIESYVRERYGSKSLRIFKVILEKIQLEQKQIEDFSMIPSKDCKALLYEMLNYGLLSLTELSKTSDHAPSRTFYLFNVDIHQISKKLLQDAYKAMLNVIIKREHLVQENKRLLEKNQKINARIDLLVAQGASQTEIDYEKTIMSTEEMNKLNSFTEHCNKLELAEIELEETIFIFETYFYYHTVTPVIQTGRSKQQ